MTRKLTVSAVEKLKPPQAGRREVFDALQPGFGVRITDKGHRSWIVLCQLHGKRIRCTIPMDRVVDEETGKETLNLAEARETARQYARDAKNGRDPRLRKAEARLKQADTFAVIADDFIERYARRRGNRSWKETKRLLDKYVIPVWGQRPIREITRSDVVELLDRVEDDSGFYTANRVLAAVRKLFNWLLVERGKLDATPIVPGMARGKEVKRENTLDDEELKALWNADLGYPFGPFIRLLLVTGQRLREVATMRWQDIDLEARVWTLPAEATKPGRKHEVPLSAPALEVLEALPRFPGPYVFSTTAGEKPISGFSRAKRRADQLSGVSDWRFHDLRRTVGTGMARLQVSKEIRGRVLNHAQKRDVTDTYDSYEYLPEKARALEIWAQKLTSIIRPADDKVVQLRE